jgi:arginyl-tRNA--protein-N-Asp/Glu arginylyltransferase
LILATSKELTDKFTPYDGDESRETVSFKSRQYISIERATKVLFEDDVEVEINEDLEVKYQATGNEAKIAIDAGNSRPYTDFFEEFVPNKTEEAKRKHKYSVSIHRAISYPESLEIFKKFDKSRFDKDRLASDFEGFLTNSPLYDPRDPHFKNAKSFKDDVRLDGDRFFKDEGVYPEYYGGFHIHHRIDDKLVAINVWDITETTLGSIYTLYDPAYSFLSLGHVTAVREMEYMKRISDKYNPNMRFYYMGYYVYNCQKSTYKEHMHPQKLL